ncbi:hypothetical protein NDU88_000049 [Pleurodeles waltl]|uniref:Uncharacterized protein n=1 Tax=Pleurodeles waltl TaxID=8319 RepID=A0AAV7V5T0_PLEWA|nr:hypothetical protein NDU88_000049 [Pleurodeles waltl]
MKIALSFLLVAVLCSLGLVSAAPEGLGLLSVNELTAALKKLRMFLKKVVIIEKPFSRWRTMFFKRVTVLQIWRKTYVVDYCFTYMEDIVLLYRSCSIEAMCLESDTHRQSLSSCADQFFCFVI